MIRKTIITAAIFGLLGIIQIPVGAGQPVATTDNYTIQILHTSDNESAFVEPSTLEPKLENFSAVVNGLRAVAKKDNIPSLLIGAGDFSLPGPFYEAAKEVPDLGAHGLADITFFNILGLQVMGLGNHEMDNGINDLATMISKGDFPFVASNLDFSKVQLDPQTPKIVIGQDATDAKSNKGKVVKSTYVDVNGEKIGVIGRAPTDLFTLVKDSKTSLLGLDFVGGRDEKTNQPLQSATKDILEQVALLEKAGVNKVILLDHAQDYSKDPVAVKNLKGVDIIVAAGSTGFMARPQSVAAPFNVLRAGDKGTLDYPQMLQDKDNHPVVIVNSDEHYNYIGNLIVTFDQAGLISKIDDRSGPVANHEDAVKALSKLTGQTIKPDPKAISLMMALTATPMMKNLLEQVAYTQTELNGKRSDVRSRETNLGNLLMDSWLWAVEQRGGETKVDLAFTNGGSIRNTIMGPKVTRFSIASSLAFNNKIAVIEVTGSELLAAFENGVSRYPSRDGRYPQTSGVQIDYDYSKPGIEEAVSLDQPSRIKNLVITSKKGQKVTLVEDFKVVGDLNQTFVVATNKYLLSGGDGYKSFQEAAKKRGPYILEKSERDILADYMTSVLKDKINLADNPNPTTFQRMRPTNHNKGK